MNRQKKLERRLEKLEEQNSYLTILISTLLFALFCYVFRDTLKATWQNFKDFMTHKEELQWRWIAIYLISSTAGVALLYINAPKMMTAVDSFWSWACLQGRKALEILRRKE